MPRRVTSGSRGDAHHCGKQRNSLASTIGSACLLQSLGPSVARQLCTNYVSSCVRPPSGSAAATVAPCSLLGAVI